MLLLFNHWLAPLVEADPELVALLESLHTVYRVPDLFAGFCLAGAAVFLFLAWRRLART